jgi:hypothetical protein
MPTREKALPPPPLAQWKALSEEERRRIVGTWNPYSDDGEPLLREIEREFKREYGHLKGLDIHGIGNCHGSLVIGGTHKLVFDRRLLPHDYLGLPLYFTITDIPGDFQAFGSYIWAPENYERLVDQHADTVRKELGNPDMSREEMLHALCGREFDKWVEICRGWGHGYTNK